MGNKKTTKNLLYLLGVVLIIAIALLVYGSYANKAQAPAGSETIVIEDEKSADSQELDNVSTELDKVDSLNTDELDSAQEDVDSINLSDI